MSRTTCRYHPDLPAEFECADCHKRFCSKCVGEVSGKYYCEVCRSRLKIDVRQDLTPMREIQVGDHRELTEDSVVDILRTGFAGKYKIYKRGDIRGIGATVRKSPWTGMKVYIRHQQVGQDGGAPSHQPSPLGTDIATSLVLEALIPIADNRVVSAVRWFYNPRGRYIGDTGRQQVIGRPTILQEILYSTIGRIERRLLRRSWKAMGDEVRSLIENAPEFK